MTESVVERAAEPAGERAEPDVPSPGPDFAPTQPIPARRFFVVEFPARVKNPDRAIACLGGPVKLGQTISASDAFHASREAAIGMAVPSSGLSLASLFPKLALAGPVDPAAGSGPATASAGPGEPRGMRADETPAASATAAATAASGISRRDLPELWVDFTAETIPTEPPNPHLAHWIASNLGSHGLETLRQLRQLFEERPIWLRKSLFGRLPRTDTRLFKQLISLVAYTFTRGPWKFCWVRFGYDPRKDPASRLYQRLELRDWEWRSHRGRGRGRGGAALAATLRAASHRAHSPVDEEMDDRIDAATSSAAEQLASLRHHPARVDDGPGALADGPGAPIDGPGVSTDDQAAPDSQTGGVVAIKGRGSPPAPPTEGPPDALILGPNTPSRQLQSAYQLCDITVESIRELINLSTVVRDTCDARTGWYIEEAYGMITKLCRMRITMGPAFAQETSVRDTLMLFQAAAAAASGAGGDIRASSSAGGLGSSSSSPGMPMTEATSPASGGILGSPADRADIEFPTFDEEEEDDEEEEEEDDDEEDDEEEEENDDDDDEGEEDGAAATTGSFLEPGASADAGARGSLTSGRALAGMGSMSLPAGLSGALWLASQGPPAAVPTDSAQTVSALQAASMAIQAGMPGSTSPVLADAPTFSSVAAAVKAATELGADGEDDDFRPYDVFGDDGDPDEEDSEEEEEDDEDDDSAMIF
ncbi:hypothetical protein H696_06099 [Fonticula alba]|uniref:Transcription factor IIIC subunit 5 HTH domain-containing protein n=1 Tax=Fonticula alba TaxID=691883 RepID=A0A058YZS5_FONAL|nr:hypothetical protein H696_06099 [Fonticula alba]KCV67460.1 hypothetical protein H696_06099 [Fonticula alba]|eukprot:XP_009498136.1 hypothetical protein H696_06099 [Fonticula alba]